MIYQWLQDVQIVQIVRVMKIVWMGIASQSSAKPMKIMQYPLTEMYQWEQPTLQKHCQDMSSKDTHVSHALLFPLSC